jgi:exodeoxyribonuclease-3
MKIISYNVNGIRAAISKGFMVAKTGKSDVVCLQEIKASRNNLLDFQLAGYPIIVVSLQRDIVE